MTSEHQKRQRIRSALEFYRPARPPDPRLPRPGTKAGGPEQLTLDFDGVADVSYNGDFPLRDVFPEAYL